MMITLKKNSNAALKRAQGDSEDNSDYDSDDEEDVEKVMESIDDLIERHRLLVKPSQTSPIPQIRVTLRNASVYIKSELNDAEFEEFINQPSPEIQKKY